MTDEKRLAILAEVRSWIGTPFRHQGRIKGIACDCIGLIIAAVRAAGVSEEIISTIPIDYSAAPHPLHGDRLRSIVEGYATSIEWENAKVADLVLLAWRRYPIHMGVIGNYLHGGVGAPFSMVHSDMAARSSIHPEGCVSETRLTPQLWSIMGVYRYGDLD